MTYLRVQVDTSKAKVVRQGLANLRKKFPLVGREEMFELSRRIRRRMAVPAPKPDYPINWDTLRQRKAFFATGGFGGGIPHKRKKRKGYPHSFRVIKIKDGYKINNSYPGAVYIGGDERGLGQSRIHAGRWPLFRREFDKEVSKMPKRLQRSLRDAAERDGINVNG